jgi:predicted component of type VI protein secretion system
MKTNSKKIMKALVVAIAIIASSASTSFAQTSTTNGKVSASEKVANLNVQNLGGLRFKLSFENPTKQKAQIYLVDKDNAVYYQEYASGDAQYTKAFNLTNLVDGEYTFVVQTPTEKVTQNFVIRTQINRGATLAKN